jgi:protein-tyrosine phosphatase
VKWGLVYRSNHLADLTAGDYEYLSGVGIKLVCDLRTDGERKRSPTVWQGSAVPEIMPASVLKDSDVVLTPERLRQLAAPRAGNEGGLTYDNMVTEFPAQYGNVLRRLAHGELPSVTHCTAGKDRTGVFSAILLTLLGVPRDVVVQDYMLTGEYMASDAGIRRAVADWQKLTGASEPPDPALVRALYTMRAETLTSTFDTITRTYGSFDRFVRDALKLADGDIAALHTRLLE